MLVKNLKKLNVRVQLTKENEKILRSKFGYRRNCSYIPGENEKQLKIKVMKKEFTGTTVNQFRKDFQEAMQGLEEKYGCEISLGTLRYSSDGVRGKMTAQILNGEKKEILSGGNFNIGDKVRILHKKADPKLVFVVKKINKKSIKVTSVDNIFNMFKVSPSLLEPVK
jgi:hypothetical protein